MRSVSIHSIAVTLLLFVASQRQVRADAEILHSFAGGNGGANPESELVLAGQTLYGVTRDGGDNDRGTIFRVSTDGTAHQVLHRFTATTGTSPGRNAGLTLSGSTLFGTTADGGTQGTRGNVFRINTNGNGYQVVRPFNPNEYFPISGVVLDGATLYGATGNEAANPGMVYRLNTNGTGYQVLRKFDTTNRFSPVAHPPTIIGTTLYGVNAELFRMNTDGSGFQTLHTFNSDGATNPTSGLLLVGTTFFGTTDGGGRGTIYKIKTDGTGFEVLHRFGGVSLDGGVFSADAIVRFADGGRPSGELAIRDGVIYGTTTVGGKGGRGTAYRINTDGTGYEVLHDFLSGPNDPRTPSAGVVIGNDRLYTTTRFGGSADAGTIVAINIPGPSEVPTIIAQASFDGGAELGFTTEQSPLGVNPFAGIAQTGGQGVLLHRSVHATTTFDAVDLGNYADVSVTVRMRVADTSYEMGDGAQMYVTNGADEIHLFYEAPGSNGVHGFSQLAPHGFIDYAVDIPNTWTSARLIIESATNSSAGAEQFEFDNVRITGVVVIPEPSAIALAALGLVAAGIGRRRK